MFAILLLGAPDLRAQEYPDSKGKDFWLTFMPNFHNRKFDQEDITRLGDSLYIFIAATGPTKGTITYRNREGLQSVANFSITDPRKIYTFRVESSDFELLGLNNSGEPAENPENGRVLKHSFHVETDQDVTVYALNQAYTTSDAFLVLPTDAIGTDYMVMSYNSDKTSENDLPTPSQFAIVATEDGTEVTIDPVTGVFAEPQLPLTINLNKGEVYLIQADVVNGDWRADLTGSEITATKPIGVFSGHQRATAPVSFNFGSQKSRDHLVEQMPPVDTWGRSAFLVPYPLPRDINSSSNGATDSYRVLAAYDKTELVINGNLIKTMDRGEFFEAPLTEASVIKTSRATLVAQFKKTSDVPTMRPASKLSDPFMMLIPPSEQFLNSYRFINAQAYQYSVITGGIGKPNEYFLEKAYEEQFISVVVPTSSLKTVKLDGSTILSGNFKTIPGSEFSYATIPVSDGVHTVDADTVIGLYVYGYGFANSYGYIGGMSFRPIDFVPPRITAAVDCFKVNGVVYDSLETDSRIESVQFPPALQKNVNVEIVEVTLDSVRFTAQLADIYNDGEFVIVAEDISELIARDTIAVPGFTVSSQFLKGGPGPEVIDEEIAPNKERCYTITLKNYGKFPQNITQLRLSDPAPGYTLLNSAPIFLKPGDSAKVVVCFKSANEDSEFSNTLIIGNTCGERTLAALKNKVVPDKQAPVITKNISSCGDERVLTISEVLKSDMGIASVEVLDSTNITFLLEGEFPETLNLKTALTDPYRDGFYSIEVKDSVGNTRMLRDTIQGFTIAFPEIAVAGPAIIYQNNSIGFFSCDSLKIINNGTLPFVFKNAYMLENIYFSVPQSQLPFTLMPGESRQLNVCYRPLETRSDSLFRDTLVFSHNCLVKRIPLEGESLEFIYSGNARCDVKLRLTTEKVPAAFLLKQNAPNPVQESTSITFALKDAAPVKITLYDARGMAIATMLDENKNAGTYELEFIPKDIPNGLYMYELQSGETRLNRTMLIAR